MGNDMYVRYPSSDSEQKLSKRLRLFWEPEIQDWDLIVTDISKISDFLKVYQKELKYDDDKFTLMGLIVSTFDDYLLKKDLEFEKQWDLCRTILKKESYLHYSLFKYWGFIGNEKRGEVFNITPYMKEIWEEVECNFR